MKLKQAIEMAIDDTNRRGKSFSILGGMMPGAIRVWSPLMIRDLLQRQCGWVVSVSAIRNALI